MYPGQTGLKKADNRIQNYPILQGFRRLRTYVHTQNLGKTGRWVI